MAFDPDFLLSLPLRHTRQTYTQRDTMLYALAVGAGREADSRDLCFVYEERLKSLPTMAVVLAYPGFWQKEPQYHIDWKKLLHAEQSVLFHRALPVEGEVRSELIIEKIIDKGAAKGALLYSTRRLFEHASDELLATVRQVSFLRGDGGRGGSDGAAPKPYLVPEREPDETVSATTRPEQALLYRLLGDYNPLHADPGVAAEAGLPRPILHGLCTYGIVGRILLNELCESDPTRMKRLDCRFTAPVFPGDDLEVAIWREAQGGAAYQVRAAGRAAVVDNGYLEFSQ